MEQKKQSVRDQTITAVGGLVGGALGALAGPEGAALAGAAGSVGALMAANYVPAFFEHTIVQHYLNNRRISLLLKGKIEADFRYSWLDSQGTFDHAMESARATINAANATDPSVGTYESLLPRGFRWSLPRGDLTKETLDRYTAELGDYCQTNGPIRIACAAICCGPIAVFTALNKRFSRGGYLQFQLYTDEINGRDCFTALRGSCDIDFAIGPLEALVLCDPERKLPLRVIGPMFGERQWIFISKRGRKGFRSGVWVFTRSSADLQYLVGIAVPRSAEKKIIEDARDIPDLVENIPPGDMVIAWEPLSNVLSKNREFAVVPQSDYMLHFVLLGHRRIFVRRRFPLEAFLSLFLTEWRRFQQDHRALPDLLRRDNRYMKAFALGCGHHWTHEV